MATAFGHPLALVFAVSLVGSAVALLFAAWRKRGHMGLTFAGWVVAGLSVPIWMAWGGPDRGLAFGLMSLCAAGLVPVLWQLASGRAKASHPKRPAKARRQTAAPPLALRRRTGTAFRVIVLSLLGANAGAIAIYAALDAIGWQAANAIVAALFAFPILWAALACAVTIPPSPRTKWGVAVLFPLIGVALIAGARAL